MESMEDKRKILTFQVKFKGNLDEEIEVRKAVEQFIMTLKLNICGFKARVLTKKEIESLQ
jgi:hypothetical protein